MDFGLNEEQLQLAAATRKVVEGVIPFGQMHKVQEAPAPYEQALWQQTANLGWLGLLVESEFGGVGLGPVDLVAIQEELGRGVTPGSFLSSAVIASTAIGRGCSLEQKARLLEPMVRGETTACLVLPARDSAGVFHPSFEAEPAAEGRIRLHGRQSFVLGAQHATWLLVPARRGGETVLCIVDRVHPHLAVTRRDMIDPTRDVCTVSLDGAEIDAADVVYGPDVLPALENALNLGRVALCAEMVGGAERVLEVSVEYARTRVQFGKPIGAFQAIQHKCADMLLGIETARAITLAAAMSLTHGDEDAARDASIAKAHCANVYINAATEGVQIHGAMGFTWELDMQSYFKRAKACETLLGDARQCREAVAMAMLGEIA